MIGEQVVRVRRVDSGQVDRYGVPILTEQQVTLTGAAFDPGGSREPVEVGRAAVVTAPRLFFQSWPDVAAGDRIEVRGTSFEVIGDPADWRSPWGGNTGGLVVELQVVTG